MTTGAEKQRVCEPWCGTDIGHRASEDHYLSDPQGTCFGNEARPGKCFCSGKCNAARRPVNPIGAPVETGELTRELSFVEACEVLLASDGTAKVQHLLGGEWVDWSAPFPTAACLSPQMVVQMSNYKWRAKPTPPAPRVEVLAREAMNDWDKWTSTDSDERTHEEVFKTNIERTVREIADWIRTGPKETRDTQARLMEQHFLGLGPKESR